MEYGSYDTDALRDPPEPAGLSRRVAAGLIDVLILIVLLALVTAAGGGDTSGDDPGTTLIFAGATLLYFFLFEVMEGNATPGKRALGMKVVMATDGSPPGTGAITLRTILRVVDGFPFAYLIGVITIILTSRNQRLGDLTAGTLVVHTGPS